jgi:hypothetical protein
LHCGNGGNGGYVDGGRDVSGGTAATQQQPAAADS